MTETELKVKTAMTDDEFLNNLSKNLALSAEISREAVYRLIGIINSNKDLIAVLYEDLKRELKLKNDLVLMAYPAMDAMARLNTRLDTFKYANDLMTIVQIRDVISAPSAENLRSRIAAWLAAAPPPPNSKE